MQSFTKDKKEEKNFSAVTDFDLRKIGMLDDQSESEIEKINKKAKKIYADFERVYDQEEYKKYYPLWDENLRMTLETDPSLLNSKFAIALLQSAIEFGLEKSISFFLENEFKVSEEIQANMAYKHEVVSPLWQAVHQFVFNERYTIKFIRKLIEQGFGVNYRVGEDKEKTALDVATDELFELQILSVQLQDKAEELLEIEKINQKISNIKELIDLLKEKNALFASDFESSSDDYPVEAGADYMRVDLGSSSSGYSITSVSLLRPPSPPRLESLSSESVILQTAKKMKCE